MNCIILLLLLSCCSGWGDSGCGNRSGAGCLSDRRDTCRGDSGRRGGRGNNDRRDNDRRDGNRMQEDCGCMEGRNSNEGRNSMEERRSREEKHAHENSDCGCENEMENRETRGIIPPPWQEYPGFPRRDGKNDGDDCESCES